MKNLAIVYLNAGIVPNKVTHFVVIFLLVVSCMLHAAPAQKTHTVTFKVYTWFDEAQSSDHQVDLGTLYFPQGKKMTPLKLQASQLSAEHQTTITSHLVFYRQIKDEDGNLSYQPAGKTKVSPKAKNLFVYLFPEKKIQSIKDLQQKNS